MIKKVAINTWKINLNNVNNNNVNNQQKKETTEINLVTVTNKLKLTLWNTDSIYWYVRKKRVIIYFTKMI